MERTQFTFYVSWLEGISFIKKKDARCDAYEAIIHYALDGILPDFTKISDAAAMAFTMAKPNIDVSRRNALNGSKTKRKRSDAEATSEREPSENEAKPEQEQEREPSEHRKVQKQEQEQVKEQVKEQEQVQEQSAPRARKGDGEATEEILRICFEAGIDTTGYSNRIKDALSKYGTPAVMDAIRVSREKRARSWQYVQKVLESRPKDPVQHHGQTISPMMQAALKRLMEEDHGET